MASAWADIDLDAIGRNVERLQQLVGPAQLCAVVKAEAYGHGAIAVAQTAVEAGAKWLAVADIEEGQALRAAGVAAPILLLSEPPPEAMVTAFEARLAVTVYSHGGIQAAAAAAQTLRINGAVHLKVDTGMRRLGVDPVEGLARAKEVVSAPNLDLEGLWTHFAVADDPAHPFTSEQLRRYQMVVDELAADGIRPQLRHTANSAAALTRPDSRYDLVRCGIAVYGLTPSSALGVEWGLEPAMAVRSRVALVKRVGAGEAISYGLRHTFARDTRVATIPVGYADGVRRQSGAVGGEVLIRGRRRPVVGTVTMGQITVDCGDDPVAEGDEVVLIGRQGEEQITVEEWAERLDTISYEIICGIGPRVARRWIPKAHG